MTYYWPSKAEALEAGERFRPHFTPDAEMVAYNGWVIVLRPAPLALKYPWYDILDVAEIRVGSSTLRRKPAEYKRPPSEVTVRDKAKGRPPPPPKAPPKPPPPPVS